MCGKMSDGRYYAGGGAGMKYVIIGSSAAGINGARELRRRDKDSRIVLVSQDNAAVLIQPASCTIIWQENEA